jgi:hypothetical protein
MFSKLNQKHGKKKNEQTKRERIRIRAINFDCKIQKVMYGVSVRVEGKLLQHVIISYMTECLTLTVNLWDAWSFLTTPSPISSSSFLTVNAPSVYLNHKNKFPNAFHCTLLLNVNDFWLYLKVFYFVFWNRKETKTNLNARIIVLFGESTMVE